IGTCIPVKWRTTLTTKSIGAVPQAGGTDSSDISIHRPHGGRWFVTRIAANRMCASEGVASLPSISKPTNVIAQFGFGLDPTIVIGNVAIIRPTSHAEQLVRGSKAVWSGSAIATRIDPDYLGPAMRSPSGSVVNTMPSGRNGVWPNKPACARTSSIVGPDDIQV